MSSTRTGSLSAIRFRCCKASPHTGFPCGSGLARECVGSVNSSFNDTPLSRASPLPQGDCIATKASR
ncbi:hypothetical protein C1895_22610 [Pseudomonas sp. FW305-3-2-15-E-TSA4]|nr:hypothetical protein C1895_22610 [Pseudomonas sp. FW305-3-2-15-E-TSA4]